MAPATTPSPARAFPRWISALLFAALLLLLFMALEFAARRMIARGSDPALQQVIEDYAHLSADGPEWIRFVPDSELSYRLRPNFTITYNGGKVTRHNSDGFRANEDFPPKANGVLRIACFGASTTYGVAVEENNETYPARLEQQLNENFKPAGWDRVEVFNLGVGGYTSREILGTMKRMLPKLKPDVVLIQNAINDVIPRFYPNYRDDYSHYRIAFAPLEVTPLRRFAYRSQAWLAFGYGLGWIKPLSLQSQTQKPMPPVDEALANLDANPPTGYEANLTEMVKFAQDAGCNVWLLTQAYLDAPEFEKSDPEERRLEGGYRRGLLEHTAIVVTLSERSGAGLIDLQNTTPKQVELFADPIHMNAAGNVVKGKLVAEALAGKLPAPGK